jgi:dTDP-4-dehydrorhamnose 3,5-epimerase-like enzyme
MKNKLKIFSDERGSLIPFEFHNLNFEPKRMFTVSDVPKDTIRGNHAHYQTMQFIICVKGEILVMLDYGYKYEEKTLRPGECLFIDKMVWDSQKFLTGNDFMCVFASTNYDLQDYIVDKDEFYKKIKNNK